RTPRPGHADWVANVKWNGENDVAGGGHFSARLTAPLFAAGAICMQILEARGVRIAAHLAEVAGIPDERFSALDNSPEANAKLIAQFDALKGKEFPVLDEAAEQAMRAAIEGARAAGDSVGGIIECAAAGLPIGIGSPMFDGIENHLARALFGIPAVKGVEFGRGFEAARMRGSEHNDPYTVDSATGSVRVTTNNAGGVLGGITSGAPVVFRLVCKPTSSNALEQDSVDLTNGEPAKLVVSGRHDPCIAPRAVPVVEAVTAIALLDAWESFPADGFRA
ncbi:MAG: chorismate synthase, partial [Atopobiaceae bacterium]|nr:chorismate synthase [Atopobiaceae bacterium]